MPGTSRTHTGNLPHSFPGSISQSSQEYPIELPWNIKRTWMSSKKSIHKSGVPPLIWGESGWQHRCSSEWGQILLTCQLNNCIYNKQARYSVIYCDRTQRASLIAQALPKFRSAFRCSYFATNCLCNCWMPITHFLTVNILFPLWFITWKRLSLQCNSL